MSAETAWLTAAEAAAYTHRSSIRAWYEWRRRNGVIPNKFGLIAKVELDRILNQKRKPWRMASASLANLQRKRA